MADINIDWLAPVGAALATGLSLWNFIQSPTRQLAALFDKLKEEMAGEVKAQDVKIMALQAELQILKSEIQHLPDRDTAHRLELAIAELNGKIGTLDERLKPVAAISDRMQEILLEQGKR